jgi:hypothetical protein
MPFGPSGCWTTYQIGFPETLAHAEELFGRGAADDEVLGEVDAADGVEAADEGAAGLGVEARDHGADEVRAEAALVQGGGHEVGEGAGGDGPLLPQPVHVHLVPEQVGHRGDVGRQPRQAQEHAVAVLEDLGEVVGDGQGLQAETQVAGYRHAVLAYHGDCGAAVCLLRENAILAHRLGVRGIVCVSWFLSRFGFICVGYGGKEMLSRFSVCRTYLSRRERSGHHISPRYSLKACIPV